jgi:hypothetical protein
MTGKGDQDSVFGRDGIRDLSAAKRDKSLITFNSVGMGSLCFVKAL